MGRSRPRLWLAVTALVVAVAAGGAAPAPDALACAFLRDPTTYEAEQSRATYLAAIDAASVNALLPGDPYFGLPRVETGTRNARMAGARRIPATLMKAIAWEESTMTMASRSVRFNGTGPALLSFDCGHGIMQVTTGMTVPLGEGSQVSPRQVSVATHFGFNVARGAALLAEKWNGAPERLPIVGTDTAGDPNLIENWYYTTWAYNGFTGPGSNASNHPLDPSFTAWPRSRYRCDGTQSRARYPYQELVWGCITSPPQRDGQLLWAAVPVALPDLSQAAFFEPLSLSRFVFPYDLMDLPTPQPAHIDTVPAGTAGLAAQIFGNPALRVRETTVLVRLNGLPQEATATVRVENSGDGILSWFAVADERWIVVDPPAGVALGPGVTCAAPDCARAATITVTVNPTLLPQATTSGTLRIRSPNSSAPEHVVRVEVDADFEIAAPGTSRAY